MDWFGKLTEACAKNKKVGVDANAVNDAKGFGIMGSAAIKDVIGNSGLQEVTFIHEAKLELDKTGRTLTRDYKFRYAGVHGYLAIYPGAQGLWFIKSFKKDLARESVTFDHFQQQLSKLTKKV